MKRYQVKEYIRQEIIGYYAEDFTNFLLDNKLNAERIIESLLYTVGFLYVETEEQENSIIFLAGLHPEELSEEIRFNRSTNQLKGKLSEVLPKAFLLVYNIENKLNDAILYPIDIRNKKIKDVCQNIGIDSDFYSLILRNW